MNLQNHFAPLDIRTGDDYLAVKTARAEQCRIKNVRAVCCGDQDNPFIGFKTIHLHQQLVEGLLPLIMPSSHAGTTVTADRIDFINENDAWRALFPLQKQVAHPAGTNTDKHLHKI